MSSHELEFLPNKGRTIKSLLHKFDFTVDEGKERLNPSRGNNQGKHRRRKVEKSCVTPACTSTKLTPRINGMTAHTHIHTRVSTKKVVTGYTVVYDSLQAILVTFLNHTRRLFITVSSAATSRYPSLA